MASNNTARRRSHNIDSDSKTEAAIAAVTEPIVVRKFFSLLRLLFSFYSLESVGSWSLLRASSTFLLHMIFNATLLFALINRMQPLIHNWGNDDDASPSRLTAKLNSATAVSSPPKVVHHHGSPTAVLPPEPAIFLPNKANDPGYSVFYNVYVNPDDEKMANLGFDIIHEQIDQIASSYAVKASGGGLVLYYVSIGRLVPSHWMQAICTVKNITCHHIQHYVAANEDKALAYLHQFCSERPLQSVIYVHSKGSFHPSALAPQYHGQDPWRRAATAAATSHSCLHPPDSTCNACGLIFQPLPGLHFPGRASLLITSASLSNSSI
jgi:hypothetical protein